MFGFLRRKKTPPGGSAPDAGPSVAGTAEGSAPEASAGPAAPAPTGSAGAGRPPVVPVQNLYGGGTLYPAQVLRHDNDDDGAPEGKPSPPVQPQDAPPTEAARPPAVTVPKADVATQAVTALAAADVIPAVTAPALESVAPSPAASAAAAPDEDDSGAVPAPSGGLYPQAILAPARSVVLPSGDELVTLPEAERRSWLGRLRAGMSRTRGNLAGLFANVQVDDALFEELEMALLASDTGVTTTEWLLDQLRERVRRERIDDGEQVRLALRALLVELLLPLEKPMDIDAAEPLVMMIAGVNGAGKTTSIGKLAHHLQREGKSILLAAGDTFRAAAREQLAEWGSRNEVEVIAQQGGDPAAVAFDAVHAGRARRTGIVIVDTAGRLPTQKHLMDELGKIRRVIDKAMPGAPHETLLVLDGNTGQNMLAQVTAFHATVPLSGLIVTKLDGTARGGAIAALAHTRREQRIPVYFIGVGEKIDDLQAFSAEEFASALLDHDPDR